MDFKLSFSWLSPLKKDLSERIPLGKLKYFDLILKIIKTVETVIRLLNLLLTPNLSWGLIKHSTKDPTVSTVSLSDGLPFLSGLMVNFKKYLTSYFL